jgi:beta-alanine degradation protein BauB
VPRPRPLETAGTFQSLTAGGAVHRAWYDDEEKWRIALRTFCLTIAALCSFALASICHAQDVVKVATEHNKIILENADVRVIENTLLPGEKDAMHTHPSGWYYVKTPGTMKIVFADGKVATWEAKEGEGGWLQTKTPHTAENVGKTTLVYVLVEVKSAEAHHAPPKEQSRGIKQ